MPFEAPVTITRLPVIVCVIVDPFVVRVYLSVKAIEKRIGITRSIGGVELLILCALGVLRGCFPQMVRKNRRGRRGR